MTRVDDITSVLREMEGALAALHEASTSRLTVDEDAIDSLLNGQPFSIGLKDRSEDLIPNVSLWVSQHSHDISTKVSSVTIFNHPAMLIYVQISFSFLNLNDTFLPESLGVLAT